MNDIIKALVCLLGKEDFDWITGMEDDLNWWQVYLWIRRN
ncbi:hypothetical protein ES703_106731 [subsurface metagenome]